MQEHYKYLYAVAAACFIGVGSGFITLVPYVLDYEAQAMRAGVELEQATSRDFKEGIDCTQFPEIHADCEYAQYLVTTNTVFISFLKRIAYTLLGIGFVTALFGISTQFSRRDKSSKP